MKKLFLLLFLALGFFVLQAQESYVMFETMYIDVKPDKLDEFNEAFKSHARQYHAEGASTVSAHYIVNGPFEGQIAWVMGPLTFSDLDSRPSDDAHEDDWNKVMPYVKRVSEVEYWRMDADMHYAPKDGSFSKFHMRFFEVKPGKWQEFSKILAGIIEVYKTKAYPNSMNVNWNQFNTGNGRNVVAVQGFNSYSEFDQEDTWVADYESVHGEGSWERAMDEMTNVTNGMTEELREVMPELGGAGE